MAGVFRYLYNITTAEQIIESAKIELARRSFWQYCLYHDPDFFNTRSFLKQIADGMQRVNDKEINRLAVCMPPRAGKSYITSVFCAWMLGHNPTESVMRNCCTARLYQKFSYDVRDIVKSDTFKKVFPLVTLSEDKSAVTGWNVKQAKQVSFFGAGVGGTIIGFGASILALTDDLYKSMEDALSENTLEKTERWKESAHNSRLEQDCASIDIGTRWTKKDEIGKNIESGYYDEIIVVPALDENGETFCEAVKTTEQYLQVKSETEESIWLAEYQQEPIESKGILFPAQDLQFYNPSFIDDAPGDKEGEQDFIDGKIGFIDTAEDGADSLSFPLGWYKDGIIYIHKVIFTTEGVEVTIPRCLELIDRIEPEYVRVESNSGGKMFARELREKLEGSTTILPVASTTNKHTRIMMQSAFIKKYFRFREDWETIPEYGRFMRELTGYLKTGKAKHDDAPDALTSLAMMVKRFVDGDF